MFRHICSKPKTAYTKKGKTIRSESNGGKSIVANTKFEGRILLLDLEY